MWLRRSAIQIDVYFTLLDLGLATIPFGAGTRYMRSPPTLTQRYALAVVFVRGTTSPQQDDDYFTTSPQRSCLHLCRV